MIGEAIGSVGGFKYGIARLLYGDIRTQYVTELCVGHCRNGGIYGVESGHLGIGTVDIHNLVDKPCVTESIGIDIYLIVTHHEVTRIEHIEDIHVGLAHITALELYQVTVDHVLIARKLGGMITAYHLMVVGGRSLTELRNVHHAVVHCRVGENLSVGLCEGERIALSKLTGQEAVAIDVTLVDHVEVAHNHYGEHNAQHLRTDFILEEQQQQRCAYADDDKRA